MILRRLFKHRGFGINLLAGFCFLMLAVYGWGLKWEDLGGYLLVILILLVGLIGFAALLGWLLRKLMRRSESTTPISVDDKDVKDEADGGGNDKRD